MRWLVAIVLAALAGTGAYALGFGSEVAYVVRAVTRHFTGGYR
jgi:hypothetical protein